MDQTKTMTPRCVVRLPLWISNSDSKRWATETQHIIPLPQKSQDSLLCLCIPIFSHFQREDDDEPWWTMHHWGTHHSGHEGHVAGQKRQGSQQGQSKEGGSTSVDEILRGLFHYQWGKFPEFVAPVFSEISLGGDTLLERSMVSWNVTQALTRNSSVTEAANPFAAFRFFEVGRCINHYVISFCYHVWQLGTCCFTAMKAVFALRFADGCFQRSSKDWW